jgi:single-stranded-DNA-specific exonuclease
VGAQHLRLSFGSGRERLDTIAFGAFEGVLGPALEGGRGRRWHLAGRVEISHWGGRERVEFRLEDAAPG